MSRPLEAIISGKNDEPIIYTSYYGNPKIPANIKKICISRYAPKWFHGLEYKKLAPTSDMLGKSEEEYNKKFDKILNRLDPKEVVTDLFMLSDGQPFVLLCYEKPPQKCHRATVANWLRQNGYIVEECYFKGAEHLSTREAIGESKVSKRQNDLFGG